MRLTDLTAHPLIPVRAAAGADTDPFTVIYGGSVVGFDGRIAQADLVIAGGRIAEIGSCICFPEGAELVDAAGALVAAPGGGPLVPGQSADVQLVDVGSGGTLNASWHHQDAAQH